MRFENFKPTNNLSDLVKEFWIYENEDESMHQQKIIPDGFSEIIIHYGDPYRINLGSGWDRQSKMLFSNQISQYFFLENTGMSGMIGIKLHPVSFYELFEIDMATFTDQVVPLEKLIPHEVENLKKLQHPNLSAIERVKVAEDWLSSFSVNHYQKVRNAVDQTLESKGMVDVELLAEENEIGSRQLERLFKRAVGVSPKFYSRIIRFSNIFKVMDSKDQSWVKVALQSGYFDQSHFIKNFKEFTGEEPSKYGFDDINLANFFLKK